MANPASSPWLSDAVLSHATCRIRPSAASNSSRITTPVSHGMKLARVIRRLQQVTRPVYMSMHAERYLPARLAAFPASSLSRIHGGFLPRMHARWALARAMTGPWNHHAQTSDTLLETCGGCPAPLGRVDEGRWKPICPSHRPHRPRPTPARGR